MNFIPVYKGTKLKATSFMAREIATYVKANKSIEWMNTYYPGGGQDLYGASGQKLITDKITGEERLLKKELGQRFRSVVQGPDGLIYVVSDESKAKIYQLSPK